MVTYFCDEQKAHDDWYFSVHALLFSFFFCASAICWFVKHQNTVREIAAKAKLPND